MFVHMHFPGQNLLFHRGLGLGNPNPNPKPNLFDTASKEIPPTDLFGLSRHSQLTEFAGSPDYPDRPFTYSVDLRRYVHVWGTAVGRSWSNNTRMW